MGRSEAIWGADAGAVRPERHLESNASKSHYENPVFQAGPRICLGMHMAMFEASVALAMTLQKFRFHFADGQHRTPMYNANALTMSIQGGLKVTVEPI